MKYRIVLDFYEDGDISASCKVKGALITTIAVTKEEVVQNVRDLIEDFRQNEWKDEPTWQNIDVNAIEFEFQYSMMDFFEQFNAVKIGEIAKLAGLNAALVRAYANGDKNPSLTQAQKIEEAAHGLALSLLQVRVVPQTVQQVTI